MKMQIVVQNCRDHSWLKTAKEWTKDSKEAKTFQTTESALRFCAAHKILLAQIVLRFGSEELDVKIPVSDECREQ
jgi:hypothetical protein